MRGGLVEEFAEAGGEVEHEGGSTCMGLGKCHAETERFHFHAGSQREAGEEIALICAHIGAHFVVVAKADIHIVAGQKFQTEHKVTHKVGAKTLFLHQIAVGVVLILWFVVWQTPFAQVVGGDGEAEWRCAEPLRIAQLNIPW